MFSFLKQFVIKKADDAQTGFVKMLVEFDPETASEAEIGELDEALTKLTQQMVASKTAWEKEQRQAEDIRKNYDLRVSAAERLQARAEGASGEEKAQVEASLAALLGELEKMAPEVEREKNEAAEAKVYYDELAQAVKTAADRLKTARARLSDAKRRMDVAKVRMDRAGEQEERAKVVAGIKKQASCVGTAFDAMTRKAEDMEAQAEVHKEKAALLTPPKGGDDPILAQALKEAAGETEAPRQSLSERLAALKTK